MTFSFFLSIYSRCGAPASWAARHTTVCLDIARLLRGVHGLHTLLLLVHLDLYFNGSGCEPIVNGIPNSQLQSCRYLASIPVMLAPGLKRF